ncbi:MAG: DNA mismatch repair protein MutS [Thiotrichales bacterium]|nr:DNA mismatch repair protein MutS [Thiotrichales bacterium]
MVPGKPSDDDIKLFRQAVDDVKRLDNDKYEPPRKRLKAVPRKRAVPTPEPGADMLSDLEHAASLAHSGGALHFERAGVQQKTLKKLKRGQLPIEAELDLHGFTVSEAQAAMARFFQEAVHREARCVRIVHGKGFGSEGGVPIIKSRVERWLRLRPEVLAFTSALPKDGGTGAVYVLLRR